MKSATLIPSSFLPIIPLEDKGSTAPRRITLVHKKEDTLVCLLSRGVDEVTYDKPVENVLTLRMFGNKKVSAAYEPQVTFQRRGPDNKSYVVAEVEQVTGKTVKKKIPFLRAGEFSSDIVPEGERFDQKINDLITLANQRVVTFCEKIADVGLFRAGRSKEVREIKERYEESGASLYSSIEALFHEERDDTPLKKHDVRVVDRGLENYFNDPRGFLRKVKRIAVAYGVGIPVISLFPASAPDLMEQELRKNYNKRFEQISDEEEKGAIALSAFAICNPKLMSGIRRGYFEFKRTSNIGVYALQTAATTYAAYNFSPWLSVPMAIPTAISGLTIINNAIRSGGQDYSGIISTVIDRIMREKLE